MVAYLLSRLVVLVFGTLYPAYYSYKAVKSRNVKEYVKWMMYWIVFAIFSCVETVADIFASILPFYYEIKILFIFWLISPWTKGATYLYRKCIHPTLSRKEQEIDEYINQASTRGYEALKRVGKNGMTLAANAVMTSAIKAPILLIRAHKFRHYLSEQGQTSLLDQLKTYSGIAAIAAATATTEQEQEKQRTLQGEDVTDQGSRVMKTEEAELQMSAMLTPELHDLDYGGSTHGSLLQSLDRLDNRLREEREQEQHITNEWGHKDVEPDNDDWDRRMEMEDRADKDWDSVIIQDQYQDQFQAPPQPKPRAKPRSPPRRKPIPPSSPPAEFDSEGSDVERPATLRRSTSMRSSTRSSRYSSNENLASSRGRYASTENLSRRSSRKAEMVGRAIRHSSRQSSTKDGSERKSSRPK